MGNHDVGQPEKSTEYSAGFDLRAAINGILEPGHRQVVPCGWAVEIPESSVGLICPRSGLAMRHGVTVLNAPGVIDSDYRGEVCVLLANLGGDRFEWSAEDRIAQLVVVNLTGLLPVVTNDALTDTRRGDGGFGHTGVK